MTNVIKNISSLKSLLSTNKAVEVDYPGMPGFKVNLSFLSRETLISFRKKATTVSYKKGSPVETFDDKIFLQLYSKGSIKGWSGLSLSFLEKLAPVDLEGQEDMEATLEFSDENALYLMQQSNDFDSFVSETVTELSNFPSASGKK